MINKRIGRALILALLLAALSTSALAATYSTLRYGSSGTAVKQMQTALVKLGYSTGGTDGKFGPTTEKAVRQFQKDNGLKVDGLAGNQTLTLLYDKADGTSSGGTSSGGTSSGGSSSGSSSSSTSKDGLFGGNYATLKYGSRGSRVTLLQEALNELGYSVGKADGIFGAGTQKAVVAFQKAYKLSADGKAGTQTLKKIEALMENGTADTVTPPADTTPDTAPDTDSGIPTRTLRKGYTGDDVKSVQSRLKELGYYTGSIDGTYGNSTIAAVKAFQSAHKLTADGLAGKNTYKILFSDNAKEKEDTEPDDDIPSRTLRKGDTGDDVKLVQQRLKELGYYTGLVDGSYGTGTVNAVTAFQQKHKLTADGIAGSATYKKLFSDNAQEADRPQDNVTDKPAENQPSADMPEGGWTKLKRDSTGDAVTQLQNALKQLGYTVNPTEDKVFDYTTMWAVQCFQRRNGLKDDGVAGSDTQAKLYGGQAIGADTTLSSTVVKGKAPGGKNLELLHWYDDIKAYLRQNPIFTVYEPSSKKTWKMKLLSAGAHADSEPLTQEDTDTMYAVWGNEWSWDEKPVYIQLANGTWCIASMPNMPHLSGNISNNGFDGHTCVHFPRTMTEVQKNDPKNAARHNIDIRNHWRSLTGEDIPW